MTGRELLTKRNLRLCGNFRLVLIHFVGQCVGQALFDRALRYSEQLSA
jgi:hypothetical protein